MNFGQKTFFEKTNPPLGTADFPHHLLDGIGPLFIATMPQFMFLGEEGESEQIVNGLPLSIPQICHVIGNGEYCPCDHISTLTSGSQHDCACNDWRPSSSSFSIMTAQIFNGAITAHKTVCKAMYTNTPKQH